MRILSGFVYRNRSSVCMYAPATNKELERVQALHLNRLTVKQATHGSYKNTCTVQLCGCLYFRTAQCSVKKDYIDRKGSPVCPEWDYKPRCVPSTLWSQL